MGPTGSMRELVFGYTAPQRGVWIGSAGKKQVNVPLGSFLGGGGRYLVAILLVCMPGICE